MFVVTMCNLRAKYPFIDYACTFISIGFHFADILTDFNTLRKCNMLAISISICSLVFELQSKEYKLTSVFFLHQNHIQNNLVLSIVIECGQILNALQCLNI